MDCGPAALKCLLEGFGIPVSYGRLREACQTEVDGTSINTLEDVAGLLGLDVEQNMLPADQLFAPGTDNLPALIVVRRPGGATHYVVIWRRTGPLLQLMDPATGRRWVPIGTFLRDVFQHEQALPAASWREWAASPPSRQLLATRAEQLGIASPDRPRIIETAMADAGWRGLATLDGALRMAETLVAARAVARGAEACSLVRALVEHPEHLPSQAWSVRAAPDGAGGASADTVLLRGAVFLRVAGPKPAAAGLSPELDAALRERPVHPARELLTLLKQEGLVTPVVLSAAMLAASAGLMIEALVLRGLFELGRYLPLAGQRVAALAALLALLAALLLLEWPIASGVLRMGRRLEMRLRLAFLQKIPQLGDRYFQSRPKSDMAERSHTIHRIRHLPELGGGLVRTAFEMVLSAAGIVWLDPDAALPAIGILAASMALPWLALPTLNEQDLRLRTHAGALARFYLDSLLGVVSIRTHGADHAIRAAHRQLLGEWAAAGVRMQRTAAGVEGLQMLAGFGLVAWLLLDHVTRVGATGSTLLLVYWALSLPSLGQELALTVWQYPGFRNMTLRLLEPLGAPVADHGMSVHAPSSPSTRPLRGMEIDFDGVSVLAGGHTVLEAIRLRVDAGAHVAVVGTSGAGKSSLVGVLLGWHRPSTGAVRIDGEEMRPGMIERLRPDIAWVDPDVHLWNRSLLDNLAYGAPGGTAARPTDAIDAADLRGVLERLPSGLQTPLGEGGARVSGGEGQRVRLGRAMLRPDARLVILDEPFRGLDRERRAMLLSRTRELWKRATLFCITHDVGQTRSFDRVLIIEHGRVVEDGPPADLAARPGSRYRAMLEAEEAVGSGLWASNRWRRIRLDRGRLVES